MEFTEINSKLTPPLVKNAKERLTQLACELGVREDNSHVGSGLGGDTLQLCVLSGWEHRLDFVPRKIDIQNNQIVWDAPFLAHADMSIIRKRLNRIFPRISEKSRSWLPSRQLFIAMETCDNLSRLLDSGYTADVHITDAGKKMLEFPPEIFLVAVRTKIGISRIIKYRLDEHPAWKTLLYKINRVVDAH